MTADELRGFLTQHQVNCIEEEVQHGVRLSCAGGEISIVYNTGKLNVQGKKTGLSAAAGGAYMPLFGMCAISERPAGAGPSEGNGQRR